MIRRCPSRGSPVELFHTGLAPDGIPPVEEPRVEDVSTVHWLDSREPVLALSINGEHRAYPVLILVWHEIVNETRGGVPIAVTYCPLCNSAAVVDRHVGDRLVTFVVSGFLHRSALVLYDCQTESLWSQFDRRAVAGRLTGTSLRSHPVATVSWSDFRQTFGDDATVLSRETGTEHDYGESPFTGYDALGTLGLHAGDGGTSLPGKARVVGVDDAGPSVAVPVDLLRQRRVVTVEIDSRPVVVWWKPGLSSALDAQTVAGGRDIGATGRSMRGSTAGSSPSAPTPARASSTTRPGADGTCSAMRSPGR